MSDLDKLLQNTEDFTLAWENYLVLPYGSAYSQAYENYKDTKAAQTMLDKEKTEWCIFAFSICAGGVLTHVFAQTAWKAVASDVILNEICKRNWDKAFQVAHFASTNKLANFAVGSAWDTGAQFLSDKTKTLFEQNSTQFPSTKNIQTPLQVQNSLKIFLNECIMRYRAAARDIAGKSNIPDIVRKNWYKSLNLSSLANPPSQPIFKQEVVAQEIELLFYLRMIMDLDYVAEYEFDEGPRGSTRRQLVSEKSIDVAPDDEKYPTYQSKMNTFSYGYSRVEYKDLGRAIYDRVNELHRNLLKKDLLDSKRWNEKWNATISKNAFNAAYNAMLNLDRLGEIRFKNSLKV
ncbi:MAG TPA: hypothetical protein VER14_09540 [Phototrophicaceae bacterium]|nr:hypothetical protein [Phototrophicaceae bacterium]